MIQQDPQNQEFNLRSYWQILVRRRWLIGTCVLVTTVAAAVSSFLATPIYKATTTISIERRGVRLLNTSLTATEPSWLDYQNWYNTQYRIISSDAVLRYAVKQLDLENRPTLLGEQADEEPSPFSLGGLRAKILSVIGRGAPETGEVDPLRPYIKQLRAGLSVDPVRDSHLVEISFVHPDPRIAAEVANAIAYGYLRFTLDRKTRIAKQSKDWFVERVAELKREVSDLELALQDYAAQHQIVLGQGEDVTRRNLSNIQERYTQAKIKLAEARARLDTVRSTRPESLQEVLENPVVRELRSRVSALESEYREKLVQLGEKHPEVQTVKAKLDSSREHLQEQIAAIAASAIDSAQAAFEQARREEQQLAQLLADATREASEADRAMIEYEARSLELERKKATLNELIAKENEMEQSANLGDTAHNVQIIDEAVPPEIIYRPKKKLNILLGFLLGLCLGIGGAVLAEYIDNTIKSPDDVRDILDLPLLGMVPAPRPVKKAHGEEPVRCDPAVITAEMPLSPAAEAYRELRTAVLLATPGHPPRDLTVTSCQPGEGKTTTAVNLAIALAQLGRQVLLVDSDLRRPRCHDVLGVEKDRGVSTFLTGLNDLDPLIQQTRIDRLSLIAAGPVPPNPADLLDSPRFAELVETLRERGEFDHVIFDSPPLLSVVDPVLIGRQTEGVVLVIRSGYTSREAGRLGKDKLEKGRATILGAVLNAVETEHVPYQYRYYRYAADDESRPRRRGRAARAGGQRT
ncbi:MAG: polysaccharide biosynthesis tyrosine autokinase [Acidobacteria bacterium]|nr:MAG: polysaccharide biosynthesis tyrosine autokinase [Acidobacteriota bacterium]